MITLNKVSFSYKGGQEKSLHEVSLHIPKGQCVLLCGVSGCGKTTITRLINGLVPHFFEGDLSGEITVDGLDVKQADILKLSDIVGTVFQNPRTQFFNTDTDSEIVFGLENRGLPSEVLSNRLERVNEELHTQNLCGRSIFELSGGEKQKIAFASVYATSPDIFVLDEPSSNLDYHSINELKSFIKKIKQQGKTIVVAEHRLWYLMDIADRVIFMENGRLIRDMGINEFAALSENEIENMGLRARSLSDIKLAKADMDSEKKVFEVRDLTVKLGNKTILDDVSFRVSGGEIVAITGENGAGKTTLARALCGLNGEIGTLSLGNEILSSKRRREGSYMVMQDVGHQLFTDSVDAECSLGVVKPIKENIDEVLTLLSLSKLKEKHPLSLSGGQKQRLAVAVSMLCGKEILIFDEPTSGLDFDSMNEVGALIKRLAEEGKIIIIITHDREFIQMICSRVMVLESGKIRNSFKEDL